MSDQTADPTPNQDIEALRSEAQRTLDEIHQIKVQADAWMKEAEGFRNKADSEALFAFNAKGACESHSTAIAALKGTVEADVNSIVSNKQKSDDLLATVTTNKAEAEAEGNAIRTVSVAVTKNKDALDTIIQHLKQSDSTSTAYEEALAKLSQDTDALIKKVEKLLPGATSAGLASSFNAQRSRFTAPQKRWLTIFISCIVVLVIVSLPSFVVAAFGVNLLGHTADVTWDSTLRNLALRLPLLIPLVWLAIYAGRNYMLSLRLEEDYAYKEAISTAFEGYKREMAQIEAQDAANPTPITQLCVNVLTAIAERPGRIYEGKPKDITILSEAQELILKAGDLSKKRIATR